MIFMLLQIKKGILDLRQVYLRDVEDFFG